MRCFRLSHAGIVVEHDGASIVVDAGNFTSPAELETALHSADLVAAIVITHEHADHWTPENVKALREVSPHAPIFTTAATAKALADLGIAREVHVTKESDRAQAGPFALDFYGRRHEVLHSSISVIENIGVRINETLAWGGDSLTRPPFEADVLGVPIGSPWSNLSQVMDFVLNAAPRRAYLTHDGMLSTAGLGLFTARVKWCLDQYGGQLVQLPFAGADHGARFEL